MVPGSDNRTNATGWGPVPRGDTLKGATMTDTANPSPDPRTWMGLTVQVDVWDETLDTATIDLGERFTMVNLPQRIDYCHGASLNLTFYASPTDIAAQLRRLADRIHPAAPLPTDTPLVHHLATNAVATACGISVADNLYAEDLTAENLTRDGWRVTCPDCITWLKS